MGTSNFKQALEKRYSALTGELQAVHANTERIERELAHLDELEARIPELEGLVTKCCFATPILTGRRPKLLRSNRGRIISRYRLARAAGGAWKSFAKLLSR
jgi:hypothetical protein